MPLDHDIAEHRGYLMRFARLQLRNETWAEDAVSETMVAALSKPEAFGQRSQLKTWLVGILKHKVLDALRQRSREAARVENFASDGPDDVETAMFLGGRYVEPPADWG
ncbi:MAG: sigma factor, partial [Burkholderiales bacterium]